MRYIALFLVCLLIITILPSEAKKSNDRNEKRLEEKAKSLEKKLDYFFLYCKQADLYGPQAWKHCIQKGKTLQNDHLYQYTNPSYQALLEMKISDWQAKLHS